MLLNLMLIASLQTVANLPLGYQDVQWGTTVEQLEEQVEVYRATPGSEYNYSEHMEVDPEVYIRFTEDKKRIEYYFFKGKLYKIFVVYDKALTSPEFYQQIVAKAKSKYGAPKEEYEENVFGLSVKHTYWLDERSVLDLRLGAGFIYEVMVDKKTAEAKAVRQRLKRSI